MRVIFDLEADGLLKSEDGKPEATKVHSLVIRDAETGDQWSCSDHHEVRAVAGILLLPRPGKTGLQAGLQVLSQADEVVGHNILTYDIPLLQKLYPNFKLKHGCKITDTLVCSRLIWTDIKDTDFRLQRKTGLPSNLNGSHSLEAWGYRLGILKGSFSKTTDWKEWSPQMQEYCERDVEVTAVLHQKILSKNYSPEAIQLEHDFQSIIFKQEQSGFGFDEKLAQEVYVKMATERDHLKKKLQAVFPPTVETLKTPQYWLGFFDDPGFWPGMKEQRFNTKGEAQKAKARYITPGPLKTKEHPFNPDSSLQVAERLGKKYGWKPTAFTPSGQPKIDDEILSELDFPEAKMLAEYAILVKRIAQLSEGEQGWLKHVCNGRLYGSMITNGAVTGRCTHRLVVNVPKHPQPWGLEMRSMFIPTPDWWLVGCDAMGLEARCQAHFMEPYDNGAMIQAVLSGDKSKGTDVHSINRDALGLEATPANREIAKTWYYAFIYGSGNYKSGSIVGVSEADVETLGRSTGRATDAAKRWLSKENLSLSPKNIALHVKGGILKKRFLDQSPALASLIKDVQSTARKDGYLTGLDGRRLNVRAFYSAFNTLLQSAGALVMKKAACIFWRQSQAVGWRYGEDFHLVANVHDEIQAEATTKPLAERIGSLMARAIASAGEHFKFNCPLAGEFKVGKNWHETH